MRKHISLLILLMSMFTQLQGQLNEFGFSSIRTGRFDSINAASNRSGLILSKFETEDCLGNSDSTIYTRLVALTKFEDSFIVSISTNSIASVQFETAIDNSTKDTLNLIAKPYGTGCFCSCNYLLKYTIKGKLSKQVITFNSKPIQNGELEYKRSEVKLEYYPTGQLKKKSWYFGDDLIRSIEFDTNGTILQKQKNWP